MSSSSEKTCCGPTCCNEPEAKKPEPKAEALVGIVRERYGRIAQGDAPMGCCGPDSGALGYSTSDLDSVPADANLGLGCGAPLGYLALQPGETALDLGSGPGLDAFLAARQVGQSGQVIGVDMTPAMIERSRATAVKLGTANVEFREGRLESLPVADASVDAVTSNCVINLVPDKKAVFQEAARVLRPGGRLVISDIVLDKPLPEAVAADLLAYAGCISGAARRESYFASVGAAGLEDVEVLRDVDYIQALAESAPEEIAGLEARSGVKVADMLGRVRSVTFRARKPSAA